MISAKIIADSISVTGNKITTFELEYPRFIHSELMTHRVFSRNAASSRAIPIDKMIAAIEDEPAMPDQWGLNRSGMQSKEEHTNTTTCIWAWRRAAIGAVFHARELQKLGLHKQIVNRVLEPYQLMKTIVTTTEFDNFFELRCHADAQPEIKILADKMAEALAENIENVVLLLPGEWHVPYYRGAHGNGVWKNSGYANVHCDLDGGMEALDDKKGNTLKEAQMISSSCCAQVSYRTLDDGLDKAFRIYEMLVSTKPVHASPFEHIATPMSETSNIGITHSDQNGANWSGNFREWIQYRQLL